MEHIDGFPDVMNPRIEKISPRVEYNLSFEDYRNHRDHISSTGLKTLLTESPEHFLYRWNQTDQDKDHFRFGRIFHMGVLEPQRFRDELIVEPEFTGYNKDGRTLSTQSKEARDKRKAWNEAHKGQTILKNSERDDMIGMLNAVMKYPEPKNIIAYGKPEVSLFCTDPVTGLKMKGRPDILVVEEDGVEIYDIKSTRRHLRWFYKDIGEFRYDIQISFYKLLCEIVFGKPYKRGGWIVASKEAPHTAAFKDVPPDKTKLSDDWVRHGLNVLADCVKKDQWPSYSAAVEPAEYPDWLETEPLPLYEFK
jgi:hypothetical protein